MSEFEVLELLSMYRNEAATHAMNFVSVMFAFVIATYLVAEKLTHLQAVVVTSLYSLFIPLPIAASIETFVGLKDVLAQYGPGLSVSTGIIGIMPFAYIVVPGVMVLGWIISILFMFQIRASRNEKTT